MIQDVQDHTSALDVDAKDPLFYSCARGKRSSPGGTASQESPPSAASAPALAPETALAPVPAPAAPQETPTDTDIYAMQPGVTRAAIRSQVCSSAATNYRENRNNRAALAGLFQKDTVQQVHKLGYPKLRSHGNLDVANQLGDTFSTENAYSTTNTQRGFSAGEKKEKIPNTSKKAMGLPQATRWKASYDREIVSLEKPGVYELVSITAVPTGQRVIGTWWVNKIKADGTCKCRPIVQGWSQLPRIDCGGTFPPLCRL